MGGSPYKTFTTESNELEIKPLHSTTPDKYHDGDQAGTPENNPSTKKSRAAHAAAATRNFTGASDPPGEPEFAGDPEATTEQEPIWAPWHEE